MKLSKLCFTIICLIFFVVNIAFATNYYIDPSTITGNLKGTLANPWTLMSQVSNSLLPGDTVFLKNGQIYPGNWIIHNSGTAVHPIVYTGFGEGPMPEIIYISGNENAIRITNASYVVIDGMIISDPMLATDYGHYVTSRITSAIYLENSTNCKIKNCDISLVGTGVSAGPGSNYNTITNNHIYNLRMVINTPKNINATDDRGATGIGIESSYNTITYNKIEDGWAVSYDYGYDGGTIEFFGITNNNTIMYNTTNLCNGFLEIGSSGSGTSNNNIIAYNMVINCGNVGDFHAPGGSFATSINNLQYFNNVFVQTSTAAYCYDPNFFWAGGTPAKGSFVVKNNIFWSSVGTNLIAGSVNSSNIIHTNNLICLGGGSLNTLLGSTESQITDSPWTSITGDPYTWNYTLPIGSAAINFGTPVGLSTDFAGNPIIDNPDAGIYEYSSSATSLKVTSSVTPIYCNGGSASITIGATGDSAPYTGTGTFTVYAGSYNYTVTDANGINSITSVTVNQPDAISSTISAGTISTNGGSTTVSVAATGGAGAFTYSLNNAAFQTGNIFTNVIAGNYTIVIKDANGCVSTQNITIYQPPVEAVNLVNFRVNAYPNPSNSYFTISINNYFGNQPVVITVFNILGSLIYKSVGSMADNPYTFGSFFSSATYLLNVNIGVVTQTLKLVKL